MVKKKSASSRQEKRSARARSLQLPSVTRSAGNYRRLADLPDSRTDYSDAPERRLRAFDVQVGRFYRPIKQLVSLRVDADVLHWFRGRGKKYQTYMNEVIRREMQTNGRDQ
jgi:uncharacterized protein (DUF4415 family)